MRTIYKIVVFLIISVLCTGGFTKTAYAETEEKLPVAIRTYANESLAVLSGLPIYSCVPLFFTPEAADGPAYAISIDDGVSFGGYAPMEQADVALYPDDKTSPEGRWRIKFKTTGETVRESDVYSVIFDTSVPRIEFCDPEKVLDIITTDEIVRFTSCDDNGISRIVAKCNDKVIYEKHFDAGEEPKEYEDQLTLKDPGGAKGNVTISVSDVAGNKAEFSFEYLSDTEPPQISASGIEDDARFTGGATLTLTANDRESNVYIDYTIEHTTKEECVTTEVTNVSSPAVIGFSKDGIYDVTAHAYDEAGRESGVVKKHFVIDRSAPVIEIGGVSENVDARSPVGLTIEVDENLYEGSSVDITLTKRSLGKVDLIKMDTYDLQAYKDIRMVNINSDGEYELSVRATDSAGNSTGVCRHFRMDTTAPDIVLYGLNEGEVTKEDPVLRFCAGEMFYDSTVLTAVLEKKEKGGYVPVKSENRVMKSVRDQMDITVHDEGQYRLTCSAADRSGNSSSSSVSFTVDHTPPVIIGTDDINNSFLGSFKLPGRLGDLVRDMTKVAAVAFLNDRPIGDDDVIVEEGKYVLTILAEDEAGNASEKESVFVIDHSAPQIVLTGFDKNGNIRKGSLIKVSLFDEGDRLESVTFNDRNISIDRDNTAFIAVDEYGSYKLAVRATDEAGNVTDTEIHTSCEMYAPSFVSDIVSEKSISSAAGSEADIDVDGLIVGLLTTLGGTFGLAMRSRIRS